MTDPMINIFYCPSCGEMTSGRVEGSDIRYCSCGATFRMVCSDIHYTVNGDRKAKMRELIDNAIQIYKRKNDEEFNAMREARRQRAIDFMLSELLKGPIEGGTMAALPSFSHEFKSMNWTALQSAVLVRDEMCMMCGQKPSKEVHHIRPRHLKGQDHPRNLIGLCLDCHDEIHRRIDDGIQKVCEQSFQIRPSKFQMTLDMEEGEK